MLIALPNPDGSFTCTLFLPLESSGGGPSFADLTDAAATTAFFYRYFPDAAPMLHEFPASFLQSPIGFMDTIRTWPWSHGSALLLGDAAHAIVPFFGQGMNAGFEDCTLLEQARERQPPGSATDWARLFAEFARDRRPDTDAIADMALENYVEMRDKVTDRRYLLKRAVEAELGRLYPGEYRSRYQLVTFTRTAYRLAAAIGRMQDQVLDAACAGAEHAGQVDYTRTRAELAQRLSGLLADHPERHAL
jgi:kynurenine 3-monooxygenase